MIAALLRILVGGLLAVAVAALVFEITHIWITGQDPDFDRLLDSVVDMASWAWPFAAVAAFLTEPLRQRNVLFHVAAGMLVALGAGYASRHGYVPSLPEVLDLPDLSTLVVAGGLAGFVYWLTSGRWAGWAGADEEARLTASTIGRRGAAVDSAPCWSCRISAALLVGSALLLSFLVWQPDEPGTAGARSRHAAVRAMHGGPTVPAPVVADADVESRRKAALSQSQASTDAEKKRQADDDLRKLVAEADAKRRADDAARLTAAAEAEARRKAEDERRAAQDAASKAEDQKRIAAESEAKRKVDADNERRRLLADAEAKKKKADDDRRAAEAEAKRKAEAAQRAVEAEAKLKAEAAQRQAALATEAEAKRKMEVAQRQAAADAEAARKAEEERRTAALAAEAKRKADAEVERRRVLAEAEAKKKADEARRTAEVEAARLADAAKRAAADAEAAAKRKSDAEKVAALAAAAKTPAATAPASAARAVQPSAAPAVAGTAAGPCPADADAQIESLQVAFARGTTAIGTPDPATLDRIATLVKPCQGLRLRVMGHTDRGDEARTRAGIALQRAQAVRSALVARGVAVAAIETVSFGATRPLASNATAEGRTRNRRVELALLSREPVRPEVQAATLERCGRELIAATAGHGAIGFASGSARVDAASAGRLDAIAKVAKSCPGIGFDIIGHTDKIGVASDNLRLSRQRASAVRAELAGRGVPPWRIGAKGVGGRQPLDPGDSPEANARNRRIEVNLVTLPAAGR